MDEPQGGPPSPDTSGHPSQEPPETTEHARPRKRTRMACDKCSSSRTRCDGQYPCRRCQDYGYTCHYNRQIKKRGRVPRNGNGTTTTETSAGGDDDYSADARGDQPLLNDLDEDPAPPPSPPTQSHAFDFTAPVSTSSAAPRNDGLTPQLLSAEGFSSLHHHRPAAAHAQHAGFPPEMSDPSESQGSPAQLQDPQRRRYSRPRASFSTIVRPHGFGPFSPRASEDSPADGGPRSAVSQYGTSSSDCRYRCLEPLLPYLNDTLPASVACDLFDVYLVDPGTSLFHCASPYILTRIFRKKSLLHPTNPRHMSPALLASILWCCAQTADLSLLLVPGSRSRVTNALYELATFLVMERDPDRWRRIHGGLRIENEQARDQFFYTENLPSTTESNEPAGAVDDVLTFLLLCIGVSGGDFKSDCNKWWSKAVRLAMSLRLNREDEDAITGGTLDSSRKRQAQPTSLAALEAREERRRVFWLLYALDRHLALSFNRTLHVPDSCCEVFAPLPEDMWESLDEVFSAGAPPRRVQGPPTNISGASFFEYFLPLMVILGDIIEAHHYQHHPRLGNYVDAQSVAIIANMIAGCEASLDQLARSIDIPGSNGTPMLISNLVTNNGGSTSNRQPHAAPHPASGTENHVRLVIAYSTHILHVLHVLLHGKWDAISMLDNDDDWITTARFSECASHAIAASEAVSDILKFDPELTFMPYLLGIYLLHGSFILLLFADRMPQLGPNQSVEQACETIIRAHEVCVVTLSTEFQRNFRRVVRSTLYSVRGSTGWEEHKLARRRVLSLYRWTKGAKGLGI